MIWAVCELSNTVSSAHPLTSLFVVPRRVSNDITTCKRPIPGYTRTLSDFTRKHKVHLERQNLTVIVLMTHFILEFAASYGIVHYVAGQDAFRVEHHKLLLARRHVRVKAGFQGMSQDQTSWLKNLQDSVESHKIQAKILVLRVGTKVKTKT